MGRERNFVRNRVRRRAARGNLNSSYILPVMKIRLNRMAMWADGGEEIEDGRSNEIPSALQSLQCSYEVCWSQH